MAGGQRGRQQVVPRWCTANQPLTLHTSFACNSIHQFVTNRRINSCSAAPRLIHQSPTRGSAENQNQKRFKIEIEDSSSSTIPVRDIHKKPPLPHAAWRWQRGREDGGEGGGGIDAVYCKSWQIIASFIIASLSLLQHINC